MDWLEAALAVCAAFVVGFVAGLELLIYPFAGGLRRASGRVRLSGGDGKRTRTMARECQTRRPGITRGRSERRGGREKETLDKNQHRRSEGRGVVGAHLRLGRHDDR